MEARAATYLGSLSCRPILEEAAAHYSRIKLAREAQGRPLAENDLWIAAAAVELGAVLVTRDSDFANTPGLSVEDWTLP